MFPMTSAVNTACLAFLLACGASAYRGRLSKQHVELPRLTHASLATIPMSRFAGDCWKRHPVHRLALNSQAARVKAELPGAGMDPQSLQPFTTVLKDGFFEIACSKDYLLNHGDKFGDGKYSYMLGDVANVSIVHYTEIVAKEDQEAITHEVCFKFCRTVPDMLTFGIHNGRDCYCAPYFKPMESDSSNCDAVCEGNPTQMCGGKFKSSVFEMHECADTAAELNETGVKAASVMAVLDRSIQTAETLAADMQTSAEALQQVLGAAGDPAATGLMQEAKVFAGKLEEAVNKSKNIKAGLESSTTEAASMIGTTLSDLEAISNAEALMETMEKLSTDGEDAVEDLDERSTAASPSGPDFNASVGAGRQYYPLMYFVDKSFEDMPATCIGEAVANPMVAVSSDECAYACDAQIHSCVGFSFFTGSPNLCFMFSKFTEVTYYTGCNSTLFLQRRESAQAGNATPSMACMAKFSKLDGTSVKPDPSGKCGGCLKKATKAARCP
mmetsp:Transcript_3874/g.11320  ORF Transcript_3874/g.11320 Transcript_3874/m.11320 type:complete len:498 (-) Transcript_3874:99-1592(-)